MTIAYDDFAKVDIRAGTVLTAQALEGARKPAYKLRVDFGPEIGERNSSVQITVVYRTDELIGKRIAGFMSAVLVLGMNDLDGNVVLVRPQYPVPNGTRLF